LPPFGCINIHVSLLPRWRGAAPIEYSLMSGDKETGISIIQLIEKLDAGPIIKQKKVEIEHDCNKNELSQKLTEVGIKLLLETIPLIFDKKISYSDQDDNDATYANKISSLNRKINFNKSVNEVLNLIRAHSLKPGAWFTIQNERIKIIKAKKSNSIGNASTILNETFDIGCNDGSIEPLILQREGKNAISKDDFLRGYSFKINDIINA
ncbi:formyltransferase family protein, partial [Pelagibacteraceae bacterium]|nr:formyltransferase family protein [Pelagibacteraceae bacterium]